MPITAAKALPEGTNIGRLVREPLYDTEALTSGNSYSSVTFFAKPQGQTMNDGTVKAIAHTNLTQANMLGEPNQFILMGFRVKPVSITTSNNTAPEKLALLKNFRSKGVLEFGLGGKIFYELPLNEIPEGLGFEGFWTLGSAADGDVIRYGRPEANVYYTIRLPKRAYAIFNITSPNVVKFGGYQLINATTPITCRLTFTPALSIGADEKLVVQVQLVGIRLKVIG